MTAPARNRSRPALASGRSPDRRIPHPRALGLLVGTHVLVDFHQGAVPALLPFLVAQRHYTYAAATGITLAATLLSSLVQPAFGVLTDRRSLHGLVAAGLLVAGVGLAVAGLSESYALTWLAIAISGIGVAAYHPEAASAARTVGGRSARGMSLFSVGGTIGVALAPLAVTPVLARWGVGATPLLVVPAVVGLCTLYPGWERARRRVAEPSVSGVPADPARPARPADPGPDDPRRDGSTVRPSERDDWTRFAWLTGAVTARSIAYFGAASLVALYLVRDLGASNAVGGMALTAMVGAGAIGNVLGGTVADRVGKVRTIRIGYVLALPAIGLIVFAPSIGAGVPLAFVGVVVFGAASFLPFAVHVTLGQEYLPRRVGTASGVTLGLAMTVGGLVAPLLGMLADAHGLGVALGALGIFPLVSLACSVALREPGVPARA